MREKSFDHVANGRTYVISQGETSWAVNDVTSLRAAIADGAKPAKALREHPTRWVAYCDSKEQAVQAAESDV